MNFKTLAIHAGHDRADSHGAVVPPIIHSSTFAFEAAGKPRRFDYGRSGNPTRRALEVCLAALESGTHGFAFATGMAAELTALMLFRAGDTILVQSDLYGGTWRLITSVLSTKGIHARLIDLRDLTALEAALTPEVRGIWIESPTNPLMNLVDLAAVAGLARGRGVLTICDNTFLSPCFQRPLALGIDIVVHSTTKYINGHSDVVGGAIVTASADLGERLGYLQNALGTVASPSDCSLVLRGIRTLAIRMEEHNRNALHLAAWLEAHPGIGRVLHPGLPSHPQHDLALRQTTGHGGAFAFRIKGGRDEAFRLLNAVRLFTLAESLGGVESLIEHPRTMTHASIPAATLDTMGIGEDLIRISVGIEDVNDLQTDLAQALHRCFDER